MENLTNASPEQIRDAATQARMLNFKKAVKDMIATSKAAYAKRVGKYVREREVRYDKEQIRRIVQFGGPVEQAKLSEHFFRTNGIYKRIILHYATFLYYAWILVPHLPNQKDKLKDKKISQAYFDAADFCSTFQIERKCALFAKEILVKGAYYGLIHDSGQFVAIQDLPFEFCRSRFKNQHDVDIVEFNMEFFDTIRDEALRKEILQTYPKCVQKGYYDFHVRKKDPWIFLPAELGIYFAFFDERPFFMDLIPLLDDLDDYRDIDKRRNMLALEKILVQEIPHDGLNLVFEPDEAQEMHAGVLDMLAGNEDVDVVTTYGHMELLDMSSDDDEKTELNAVQDLIYEAAGISKELFGATTAAGIEFSLNNDLAMCMMLGNRFAHFFTMLTNYKFGSKKVKFKFLILPVSFYNCKDYTSRAKDLAAFGYSFLTPILSTGIDQTNLADLKELENELLDLDEVLKPLQSAYTQSGKTNAITAQAGKAAEAQAKTTSSPSTTSQPAKKQETKKETKKEETKKETTTKKTDKKSDDSKKKSGEDKK